MLETHTARTLTTRKKNKKRGTKKVQSKVQSTWIQVVHNGVMYEWHMSFVPMKQILS